MTCLVILFTYLWGAVLSGVLLDTNDFASGKETPVVGAVVSLLDTGFSTTSDASGHFTLSGIPAGEQVLDINSSGADPAPDQCR